MSEEINENLKKPDTWKRLFFMLVYAVIDSVVTTLLWIVVVLQVATALFTGNPNRNILTLGKNLAAYRYQIMLFMTFNTERLPFPFSDWQSTVDSNQIDQDSH